MYKDEARRDRGREAGAQPYLDRFYRSVYGVNSVDRECCNFDTGHQQQYKDWDLKIKDHPVSEKIRFENYDDIWLEAKDEWHSDGRGSMEYGTADFLAYINSSKILIINGPGLKELYQKIKAGFISKYGCEPTPQNVGYKNWSSRTTDKVTEYITKSGKRLYIPWVTHSTRRERGTRYNSSFLITPDMLDDAGVKYKCYRTPAGLANYLNTH